MTIYQNTGVKVSKFKIFLEHSVYTLYEIKLEIITLLIYETILVNILKKL